MPRNGAGTAAISSILLTFAFSALFALFAFFADNIFDQWLAQCLARKAHPPPSNSSNARFSASTRNGLRRKWVYSLVATSSAACSLE